MVRWLCTRLRRLPRKLRTTLTFVLLICLFLVVLFAVEKQPTGTALVENGLLRDSLELQPQPEHNHQRQQQQQQQQHQQKQKQPVLQREQNDEQQQQPKQQPKDLDQQQQQEKQQLQQLPRHEIAQGDTGGAARSQDEEKASGARLAGRAKVAAQYCQRKRNRTRTRTRSEKERDAHPLHYPLCRFVSPEQHLFFCPIAKIGSTFWSRFNKVLMDSGDTGTLQSPYSIPIREVEKLRCRTIKHHKSASNSSNVDAKEETKKTKEKKANEEGAEDEAPPSITPGLIKAVFVREPFARVFSAFVDKLISPNPTYWHQWGKPALTRDGVTSEQVQCGQGVTFRQFLRDVSKRLWRLNNHVIPMSYICDPCRDRYDVIGQMETFSADARHVMSALNVSWAPGVEKKLSAETKADAVYDSIQGPFSWMKAVAACIPTPEMGRRIWRKLQLRGLVDSDLDYPLGGADLRNVTRQRFFDVAMTAHKQSTDKAKLGRQKKQAFVEAFRAVSMEDIREYAAVFEDDFAAFGYDPTPPSVFDRNLGFVNTEALDFNKPWRMSA